jgi:hypothetical protein
MKQIMSNDCDAYCLVTALHREPLLLNIFIELKV